MKVVAKQESAAATNPRMSVVWGVSWFFARRKWELEVSDDVDGDAEHRGEPCGHEGEASLAIVET